MQEPPSPELLVQAEPSATQQAACNGAAEQPTQDVVSTTAAAADVPQENSSSLQVASTSTLLPDAEAAASAAVAMPAAAELASSAAQPQHASPSICNTSRRSSRTRVGESTPAAASAPVPVLPCEPAAPQQQQPLLPPATGQSVSAAGALPCAQGSAAAASPAARQSDPSQPCRVLAPGYSRSTSSSILSLHIHGTSQLVPDLLLTDPVIRLHVVHAATGEYFPIMQQLAGDGHNPPQQQQQQQQQQTALAGVRHSSNSSSPGSRLAGSSGNNSSLPHAVGADTQAELLEYPGRPVLTTLDNNTPNPKPGLLHYIPAVQTRPYSITSANGTHSSSSSTSSGQVPSDRDGGGSGSSPGSGGSTRVGLSACWDEELCVDAAPEQLAESDALLLLELLQLPGGFGRYKRHACEFGKRGSSHSIAWAFLRLSGLQHRQLVQGQPLKLKLQLYEYSPGALKPEGLLSPLLALPHHHSVSPAKAAYLSFKLSGFLTPTANSTASTAAPGPAAHASTASSRTTSSSSPVRIGGSSLQPAPLLPATASSSSSSSPWGLGLWTPWGAAAEGSSAAAPGSAGRLISYGLTAAAAASKYPAFVEVTLAAVARPQGAVVVTDPAAGIWPALPTGYGSGFEIGRMPVSLLYMPSALRGGQGAGGAGGSAGCRGLSLDDAFGGAADESLLLLESRLHRPHTHACQVPNALLAEVKGTAGGCSAISISRDGRWLAAACGDDAGRFKVVLYQALTGRLCWVLGSHYGIVQSISWVKDDSAVVTASADFTVKLWHLPELPGPASGGSPQSSLTRHYSGMQACDRQPLLLPYSEVCQQQAAAGAAGAAGSCPGSACMSGARAGSTLDTSCSQQMGRGQGSDTRHVTGTSCRASLGAAAAAAGVSVSVLQHTCFVYAAELHPTQQPLPTVVTAGFDGVLRLWSCEGVVLHSLLVSDVPVNCITFDQLGTRLFAGDAAGTLTEVSLDLTPLSTAAAAAAAAGGSWSQAGWGAVLGPGSSPSSCDGLQPGGGNGSSCGEAGAAASGSGGSGGGSVAGGQSASGGAGLVASVLRHGSTGTQQLAGAQLMRKLRVSQELAGCPLMSLMCHPGGHHLIALARSPKGVSDLVALDAKLLLVARRFSGIRCSNAPIKFALSPDGQFVLCGSEDGTATIWDFATATPTPVGHMALGNAPIHAMAWSSAFHAVVVCSFSHFAPIRVLGYAAGQQQVALNPPCPDAAARGKVPQAHQELVTSDMHRPLRCPLPDQLTPAHVHALLSDLRLSASQRGLYNQASDAVGQLQLMVPAHPKGRHLPRRLGSSRPGSGSGHGPAAPGTGSSGRSSSDAGVPLGRKLQLLAARPGVLQDGGVDAGALHCQHGSLQQQDQKGGLTLQVSAAGDLQQQDGQGPQQEQQQQSQALIAAAPQVASQPTTPRLIDGTPKAGAAAAAAPWQS